MHGRGCSPVNCIATQTNRIINTWSATSYRACYRSSSYAPPTVPPPPRPLGPSVSSMHARRQRIYDMPTSCTCAVRVCDSPRQNTALFRTTTTLMKKKFEQIFLFTIYFPQLFTGEASIDGAVTVTYAWRFCPKQGCHKVIQTNSMTFRHDHFSWRLRLILDEKWPTFNFFYRCNILSKF